MKTFIRIIALLSLFILHGCSKSSSDLLVGEWSRINSTQILEIGGSSWHTYYADKTNGPQHRYGTYTYDAQSKTILVSIRAIEGNNGAYSECFYVQTLTSTTLSLLDMECGDVYMYKRK